MAKDTSCSFCTKVPSGLKIKDKIGDPFFSMLTSMASPPWHSGSEAIPVNLTEALHVVVNGVCKTIDLINVNDSEMCIHLSDIGLNASLIKYFEHSGKRGMWSYGKALLRVLRSNRLMNATIKIDTETVYRKAYMIVVANAAEYGTGAVINPNGYVNDGIFEIVVVRELTFLSILKMLITHKPFDRQTIEIFHTKHAEVTLAKNACFQVDGEYRGRCKKITAAIAKGCLKVMVPPQPEY